jgi:uncharacterized surface protein with fasciclin (FAS1) repeats
MNPQPLANYPWPDNGRELRISTENGSVMIDDARVMATDIMASNGVIHVIDSVVLP